MFNSILITFDTDWVHDEIIKYSIDLVDEYGLSATFFATDYSRALKDADDERFEIGIHPDFKDTLDNFESKIKELKNIYPEASGVRSHSLFCSSTITILFKDFGFDYDVNLFMPYFPGLRPLKWFNSLIRLPFYWEDDFHLISGKGFDRESLMLDQAGLKIYAFHPIHVFLNTENIKRYEDAKAYIKQPDKLQEFRNTKTRGCKDLFDEIAGHILDEKLATYRLKELLDLVDK